MPEQFDVAARRHLDTAELLEAEGRLEDAGYHYGLVGENAVKQSIVAACGPLTKRMGLFAHFDTPLKTAIQQSEDVSGVLASGRLSGGLAIEIAAGTFASRFDGWNINIRYADTDFPVDSRRVATWKADAIALLNGGVF